MPSPPFVGAIPDDRLYDLHSDMWVRHQGDEVVIGVSAFGLHLSGEIIAFTPKPRGAQVERGRGLGTVESAKTVLALHAPLSFKLTSANEAAELEPHLINADPYGAGWMVRGSASRWEAERGALVEAVTYRRHILAMAPDSVIE